MSQGWKLAKGFLTGEVHLPQGSWCSQKTGALLRKSEPSDRWAGQEEEGGRRGSRFGGRGAEQQGRGTSNRPQPLSASQTRKAELGPEGQPHHRAGPRCPLPGLPANPSPVRGGRQRALGGQACPAGRGGCLFLPPGGHDGECAATGCQLQPAKERRLRAWHGPRLRACCVSFRLQGPEPRFCHRLQAKVSQLREPAQNGAPGAPGDTCVQN